VFDGFISILYVTVANLTRVRRLSFLKARFAMVHLLKDVT